MVFSSNVFLFLFLPTVLTAYVLAPGLRARNAVLLAASLFFYAWGEVFFTGVMLISIGMNFAFGYILDRLRDADRRRTVLVLACIANLGLLAFFKYASFIAENVNALLGALSIDRIAVPRTHLPIGISFFTFQAMSYVVDVYRGAAPVQRNPFRVALYIALFPQLIAGPIVRYADVAEQLSDRSANLDRIVYGIQRFIIGLGKKVLIANSAAAVADPIFSIPPENLTAGIAWLGVVCYTIQIYFDFSGYSDMAIGLGHVFGFRFLENFQWPYASTSIREFWRRWHISLSTWFRDYLYIPLGGNQRGSARTALNLLLVFFLCGLWHGASWTFVVWGLFHGFFLILERTRFGAFLDRTPRLFRHGYVLLVVMTGWVFFRSETISGALAMLAAMMGFGQGDGVQYYFGAFWSNRIALALLVGGLGSMPLAPWFGAHLQHLSLENKPTRIPALMLRTAAPAGVALVFVLSVMSLASGTHNPFIYFRF